MRSKNRVFAQVYAVTFLLFCLMGCGRDDGNKQPQNEPQMRRESESTASPPISNTEGYTLKGALSYCVTAQMHYIFAFTRLDGQVMNADDKTYLKSNSPQEVNYWLSADNGRYAVGCSNFSFKSEHMDALKKRFKVEDFSEKK